MLKEIVGWAIYAPMWQLLLAQVLALVILVRLILSFKRKKVVWQMHPQKKAISFSTLGASLSLSVWIEKIQTITALLRSKSWTLLKHSPSNDTPERPLL